MQQDKAYVIIGDRTGIISNSLEQTRFPFLNYEGDFNYIREDFMFKFFVAEHQNNYIEAIVLDNKCSNAKLQRLLEDGIRKIYVLSNNEGYIKIADKSKGLIEYINYDELVSRVLFEKISKILLDAMSNINIIFVGFTFISNKAINKINKLIQNLTNSGCKDKFQSVEYTIFSRKDVKVDKEIKNVTINKLFDQNIYVDIEKLIENNSNCTNIVVVDELNEDKNISVSCRIANKIDNLHILCRVSKTEYLLDQAKNLIKENKLILYGKNKEIYNFNVICGQN